MQQTWVEKKKVAAATAKYQPKWIVGACNCKILATLEKI